MLASKYNAASRLTSWGLLASYVWYLLAVWCDTSWEVWSDSFYCTSAHTANKVVQNHRCFNVVKARSECGGPALFIPFWFVFHLSHPLPHKYTSQHPEVAPKDQTFWAWGSFPPACWSWPVYSGIILFSSRESNRSHGHVAVTCRWGMKPSF